MNECWSWSEGPDCPSSSLPRLQLVTSHITTSPGRGETVTLQPPAWHRYRLKQAETTLLGRISTQQLKTDSWAGFAVDFVFFFFITSRHEQGQAKQTGAGAHRTSVPIKRPETFKDAQVLPLSEPRFCVSPERTQTLLQLEGLPVPQM